MYLRGKHERDAARLEKTRRTRLVARQDALIEQYRLLCGSNGSGSPSAEERAAYDRARRRYLDAECGRLQAEVEIARVDLAYGEEILKSVLDLRKNAVATRQDVIVAERDISMIRTRLEQGTLRAARCRGGREP